VADPRRQTCAELFSALAGKAAASRSSAGRVIFRCPGENRNFFLQIKRHLFNYTDVKAFCQGFFKNKND
jgi:hypothetical protein